MDNLNSIFFGDWMEFAKTLPNNSIDCIVTDPPYGVDFKNKIFDDSKETVESLLDNWLSEFNRLLKDGSHLYLFIPTMEIDMWVTAVRKYFKFNNILALNCYSIDRYVKNNYGFDLQMVLYCSKGKAKRLNAVNWVKSSDSWKNDKRNSTPKEYTYSYPSFIDKTVIRPNIKANKQIKRIHPNQKNSDFIRILYELCTNEGDIVLEPFAGSGSAIQAAIDSNRNYYACELNEKMYNKLIEPNYFSKHSKLF